MSLKHGGATIFLAGSGRLAHYDILGIILVGLNTALGSPLKKEFLYFCKVSARAWNLCEQIEVLPNFSWVKIVNSHINLF
jgi:hypothetical protein